MEPFILLALRWLIETFEVVYNEENGVFKQPLKYSETKTVHSSPK